MSLNTELQIRKMRLLYSFYMSYMSKLYIFRILVWLGHM